MPHGEEVRLEKLYKRRTLKSRSSIKGNKPMHSLRFSNVSIAFLILWSPPSHFTRPVMRRHGKIILIFLLFGWIDELDLIIPHQNWKCLAHFKIGKVPARTLVIASPKWNHSQVHFACPFGIKPSPGVELICVLAEYWGDSMNDPGVKWEDGPRPEIAPTSRYSARRCHSWKAETDGRMET